MKLKAAEILTWFKVSVIQQSIHLTEVQRIISQSGDVKGNTHTNWSTKTRKCVQQTTSHISQIHRHLYVWSLCLLASDTKTDGLNKTVVFNISKEKWKHRWREVKVQKCSFRGVLKLAERWSTGNNNSQSIHTLKEVLQHFSFTESSLIHELCNQAPPRQLQHNHRAAGFLSPDVVSSMIRAEDQKQLQHSGRI